MDPAPIGQTSDLVVRLQVDAAGKWSIAIDGASIVQPIPLAPITLVIHVWRAGGTQIFRTSIEIPGSDHIALIQSNAHLLDLIRTWLLDER